MCEGCFGTKWVKTTILFNEAGDDSVLCTIKPSEFYDGKIKSFQQL